MKTQLQQQFKPSTTTGVFASMWCGVCVISNRAPEYRKGSLKT